MKLSVFNPVLGDMPFESAMQYLAQCGVDAVEIGCGGYPGKAHCDPALLLEDEGALSAFKRVLKKNGLELAALSAHGNPVHPDPDVAESFRQDFQNAVLLAERLGVKRIVGFSGCPAAARRIARPTGLPVPGRMIIKKFWNTHGSRCSFPTGGRLLPLPLRMG